jgi:hypothetical protein
VGESRGCTGRPSGSGGRSKSNHSTPSSSRLGLPRLRRLPHRRRGQFAASTTANESPRPGQVTHRQIDRNADNHATQRLCHPSSEALTQFGDHPARPVTTVKLRQQLPAPRSWDPETQAQLAPSPAENHPVGAAPTASLASSGRPANQPSTLAPTANNCPEETMRSCTGSMTKALRF